MYPTNEEEIIMTRKGNKVGKKVGKLSKMDKVDKWLIDVLDTLDEVRYSQACNAKPLTKLFNAAFTTLPSEAGSAMALLYKDVFEYLKDLLHTTRTFAENEKFLERLPKTVDRFTRRHTKIVL